MDKNVSGAALLYKARGGESFRAAWDRAIEVGQARRAAERRGQGDPFTGHAPGLKPRHPANHTAGPDPEPEPEIDEQQQLKLLERIAGKFMRKIVQEREARLCGQIVAADFYLRQVTVIETVFDLAAAHLGFDAGELLHNIRRRGRTLVEIVDTPFARFLDDSRRAYWASSPEEPMRPVAFREEFLRDHGDCRTAIDQGAYGATTAPARGYSEEEWGGMGYEAQVAAREAQCVADAEEQVAWEREAVAEHKARVTK